MKFKKVEINAFRAYRSKEDGTFDFTYLDKSSEEMAANLVAIYGPNGFGKTSFYDAVEWGMTNRIKRLDNGKELAKDEKDYSNDKTCKKNRQYILKNRDADEEQGEVIITLEDGERLPRKTKELKRVNQNDYFPLERLENPYFQDVILSQEGIDAFLRVNKPEERYQRFVEYFDSCKDADRLYKNITQLLLENDESIKANNKDIKEKKNEISKKKVPEDIVEQTNNLINNLKKQDCLDLSKLILLNKEYSTEEFNSLTFIVDEYRNDITDEDTGLISQNREKEIEIDNLISELPRFSRAKEYRSQAEAEIKELKRLKSLFTKLEGLKTERIKREEERETLRKKLSTLLEFKTLRPKYNLIRDDMDSKTKEIEILKKRRQEITEQIVKTSSEIENSNLELNSTKSELEESEAERAGIESKFDNYTKNLKKLNALINELKANSIERKDLDAQQEQANTKQTELQKLKRELKSGMESEFKELADLFPEIYEKLKNYRQILEKSEDRLKELEKKAENIHSLKDIHEKIISFGKRFIVETKTDKCPLCGEKEYTDFNELLTQIENSNILSQEYEDIAVKIKKQEEETQEYRNRQEDIIKDLCVGIDIQIKDIKAKLRPLDLFIYKSIENENRLTQRRNLIDSQIEQYKKRFEDKTIEEIKASLNKRINKLEQAKKRIYSELTKKKEQESDLKVNKIDIQKHLDIKKGEVTGLKDNANYIDYKNLIDSYPFLQDIEQGEADGHIEGLRGKEEAIKEFLEDSKKAIDKLEEKLRKETKQDVLAKLGKADKRMSENEVAINLYERKLKRYFDEIPADIKTGLELKRREIGLKIETLGNINNQLGTLKDQFEYLEKRLSLNKLEAELSQLNKENGKLNSVKNRLEKNKNRLSKHIESLITDFFEEELINEIYKRIDPHPEYTDIGFKPDLSGKDPKLNIYVEKKEGVMSPNLFLSTAQINVLSLSIFLARALKAKDDKGSPVDTIFIDDPIQSMDSINILSVIDLIRTIIYQHKKQVIVSTHDENFFNLLKKKMPEEYYLSRFIEFETFGKVKRSPDEENRERP